MSNTKSSERDTFLYFIYNRIRSIFISVLNRRKILKTSKRTTIVRWLIIKIGRFNAIGESMGVTPMDNKVGVSVKVKLHLWPLRDLSRSGIELCIPILKIVLRVHEHIRIRPIFCWNPYHTLSQSLHRVLVRMLIQIRSRIRRPQQWQQDWHIPLLLFSFFSLIFNPNSILRIRL